MMLSAEARWFRRDGPPPAFERWFVGAESFRMPASGGEVRCDRYRAMPKLAQLGIAARIWCCRNQGLIVREKQTCGSMVRPSMLKQVSAGPLGLTGMQLLPVRKLRWMRKFVPHGTKMRERPADEETPGQARIAIARSRSPGLSLRTGRIGGRWDSRRMAHSKPSKRPRRTRRRPCISLASASASRSAR
jgi:hypothetical protein